MRRRTGQFTALGDDGRRYAIHIYTNFAPPTEAAKELQTPDGGPVDRRDKGVYELTAAGVTVVLRSDSANAP
jgi:hypothetical protein